MPMIQIQNNPSQTAGSESKDNPSMNDKSLQNGSSLYYINQYEFLNEQKEIQRHQIEL